MQNYLQIYENKRINPQKSVKKGESKYLIYGKFTIEVQ